MRLAAGGLASWRGLVRTGLGGPRHSSMIGKSRAVTNGETLMQQSMYSPTHPTAGQPGGYHGVYLGVCCLFKPLGCGGFLNFCPQIGITGFVYIENHSDYSSDCYKIKILILQNIKAVMFKFSGEVDVRQSYMFKVMGGGVQGRQPCSR